MSEVPHLRLSAGEHVFSAGEVTASGGREAIYRLRDALRAEGDLIEIEDAAGNRVTVTLAHYNRWPSVRETFRPVADEPGADVPNEPPTGDETEE